MEGSYKKNTSRPILIMCGKDIWSLPVLWSWYDSASLFAVGRQAWRHQAFPCRHLDGLAGARSCETHACQDAAGAAVYQHILGFQEFLNRRRRTSSERMKEQNLFSKFFPYALALNVADNWAKAFEGIYQEPPDWYVSPAGHGEVQSCQFQPFIPFGSI